MRRKLMLIKRCMEQYPVRTILLSFLLITNFTTAVTYGKYVYSAYASDNARVAQFQIDIQGFPELQQGKNNIVFASGEDRKEYTFIVTNNSEVSVLCSPQISGNGDLELLGFIDAVELDPLSSQSIVLEIRRNSEDSEPQNAALTFEFSQID